MQVKLTAGFLASCGAPIDGKDRVIYWDEKRPGFGLMVTANGKRSFVFQYRNDKGESRRASLSGTTRLPDAHKWADILQGDVAKGVDPVVKKKGDRAAQSKKGRFRPSPRITSSGRARECDRWISAWPFLSGWSIP